MPEREPTGKRRQDGRRRIERHSMHVSSSRQLRVAASGKLKGVSTGQSCCAQVGACDGRGASVGGAVSPHVMPAATAIASSTRTPAGPNPRRPWTVGKRSAGQTTAIHCQLNLALPAPSFTCHRNHRSRAYYSLSPPPPSPPPWTTSASKWSCWRAAPTSPPASTMCRGRLTCSLRLAPRSQRVGILL